MEQIVGMPTELLQVSSKMWDWVCEEYQLSNLPDSLTPTVSLCFLTTIQELYALHLVHGFTSDEYLEHATFQHIADYVGNVFNVSDAVEYCCNLLDDLEQLACAGNPIAVKVTRSLDWSRDDTPEDTDQYVDILVHFTDVLSDAIIAMMRDVIGVHEPLRNTRRLTSRVSRARGSMWPSVSELEFDFNNRIVRVGV